MERRLRRESLGVFLKDAAKGKAGRNFLVTWDPKQRESRTPPKNENQKAFKGLRTGQGGVISFKKKKIRRRPQLRVNSGGVKGRTSQQLSTLERREIKETLDPRDGKSPR